MEKHDYVVLSLALLFGILAVLLFTGASKAEYDAAGDAARNSISIARACIDTDDGGNLFVRGTTYINTGNIYGQKASMFRDFCRAYDSPVLKEYYCDKGKIVSKEYKCDYGCSNGACKMRPGFNSGAVDSAVKY